MLDALVHRPELPLVGGASAKVGLALWDHVSVAMLVEAAIVVLGLCMFLPGSGLTRGKAVALAAVTLVILAFTAFGMMLAPAPPSAQAMAISSLVAVVVVSGLYAWLDHASRTVTR